MVTMNAIDRHLSSECAPCNDTIVGEIPGGLLHAVARDGSQPGSDGRTGSVAPLADSRDGFRPAGVRQSHGTPVDFPPGIRHRTFFIAGRIDEPCNGSRFVTIAYGAV
jgi:hypothetical protein